MPKRKAEAAADKLGLKSGDAPSTSSSEPSKVVYLG
jgi:hypothetical protein